MGKYKHGVNGPFSGKIGQVVGTKWRGIALMRSMPNPSKKEATQKQLDQRHMFRLVTGWLKPLKHLIWIGYQAFTGNKTPMNVAISHHMKEAVKGEAPEFMIDFAKAVFSRGELLISLVKEIVVLVNAALHIKWENVASSAFSKADDLATFIIYNPVKKKFATFESVAKRSEKQVVLQLPPKFKGDPVHCWMTYANVKGNMVSTSVYLGEILVG